MLRAGCRIFGRWFNWSDSFQLFPSWTLDDALRHLELHGISANGSDDGYVASLEETIDWVRKEYPRGLNRAVIVELRKRLKSDGSHDDAALPREPVKPAYRTDDDDGDALPVTPPRSNPFDFGGLCDED